MIDTGLYSVDVWVDFETVDKSGHVLADPTDIHDLELFKPGKVVVAFDDDHVSLALVVGRVRRGSATRFQLTLVPGDTTNTSKPWCAQSATPVAADLSQAPPFAPRTRVSSWRPMRVRDAPSRPAKSLRNASVSGAERRSKSRSMPAADD